jgi:hypothetical protein
VEWVANIPWNHWPFSRGIRNRRCIYNRNLKSQVRQGTAPAINEYMSLSEIKELLRAAGFRIKQIRLCWICVNDFLTLGQAKPLLRPIMPLRKCCFALCNKIAEVLSRFPQATPLFREIVILAEKNLPSQQGLRRSHEDSD